MLFIMDHTMYQFQLPSRELEMVVLNIGHSRIETFLESSHDPSFKKLYTSPNNTSTAIIVVIN